MDSDEQALQRLAELPLVQSTDRLYVSEDGGLRADASHAYLGCVGRSVMNLLSCQHNRQSVVQALSTLADSLLWIGQRAQLHLNSPYVRGNRRTYGVCTNVTRVYLVQLQRLRTHLPRLQQLVSVVKVMYSVDGVLQLQLGDIEERVRTVAETSVDTLRTILPLVNTPQESATCNSPTNNRRS